MISTLSTRFFVFTLILIFCHQSLFSQELTVKGMELLANDATAMIYENQRQDLNGDYAGIVKVLLAVDNALFEGGGVIHQMRYRSGEYWVWMAKDSKRIKVYAPGYLPLEVNFFDDYNIKLESKRAYQLVLTIPSAYSQIIEPKQGNNSNKDSSDGYIETFTVKGVSFRMVRVDGGTFQMGATKEQGSHVVSYEKPVHNVTLSDYMIGETEVTQELWKAVMGNNPSKFKGARNPVDNVDWNDCREFVLRLSQLTGKMFRLPTEAEWEFAARGGNNSGHYKFSGSNSIDDVAWWLGNSDNKTHPVATKVANELGLYDMSGNVYEWCDDWYSSYSSESQTNPKGPDDGSFHVFRGGCWNGSTCRVSYRYPCTQFERNSILGFRLAF